MRQNEPSSPQHQNQALRARLKETILKSNVEVHLPLAEQLDELTLVVAEFIQKVLLSQAQKYDGVPRGALANPPSFGGLRSVSRAASRLSVCSDDFDAYPYSPSRGPRRHSSVVSMATAPSGRVVFVFTDIQNSTELWNWDMSVMSESLKMHNSILRAAMSLYSGFEVKTEGDAFMIAFSSIEDAANFTLSAQVGLMECDWPEVLIIETSSNELFRGLRVRMGMHIGEPLCEVDPTTRRMDYFGPAVNKSARIASQAKGGEIVMEGATYAEFFNTVFSNPNTRMPIAATVFAIGEAELKGFNERVNLYHMFPEAFEGRAAILRPPGIEEEEPITEVFEGAGEELVPPPVNGATTVVMLESNTRAVPSALLSAQKRVIRRIAREEEGYEICAVGNAFVFGFSTSVNAIEFVRRTREYSERIKIRRLAVDPFAHTFDQSTPVVSHGMPDNAFETSFTESLSPKNDCASPLQLLPTSLSAYPLIESDFPFVESSASITSDPADSMGSAVKICIVSSDESRGPAGVIFAECGAQNAMCYFGGPLSEGLFLLSVCEYGEVLCDEALAFSLIMNDAYTLVTVGFMPVFDRKPFYSLNPLNATVPLRHRKVGTTNLLGSFVNTGSAFREVVMHQLRFANELHRTQNHCSRLEKGVSRVEKALMSAEDIYYKKNQPRGISPPWTPSAPSPLAIPLTQRNGPSPLTLRGFQSARSVQESSRASSSLRYNPTPMVEAIQRAMNLHRSSCTDELGRTQEQLDAFVRMPAKNGHSLPPTRDGRKGISPSRSKGELLKTLIGRNSDEKPLPLMYVSSINSFLRPSLEKPLTQRDFSKNALITFMCDPPAPPKPAKRPSPSPRARPRGQIDETFFMSNAMKENLHFRDLPKRQQRGSLDDPTGNEGLNFRGAGPNEPDPPPAIESLETSLEKPHHPAPSAAAHPTPHHAPSANHPPPHHHPHHHERGGSTSRAHSPLPAHTVPSFALTLVSGEDSTLPTTPQKGRGSRRKDNRGKG